MNRLEVLFIITLIVFSCKSNKVSDESKNSAMDSYDMQSDTAMIFNEQSKADSIRSFFDINDSIKVLDFRYDSQWPYYVFIDYNKDSRLYSKLEKDFDINRYSHEDIEWSLKNAAMRTSDSVSKIFNLKYSEFLGTWIGLYSMKDDLYVTNSCEPEGFFHLTDSMFYDGYYMDAPEISYIKSIAQIDNNGIQIVLESTDIKEMTLEFYKVDTIGTYLVALKDKTQKESITYMTKIDSVRNYKLVHHECDALTEKECFDKIDYNKIIKKYR